MQCATVRFPTARSVPPPRSSAPAAVLGSRLRRTALPVAPAKRAFRTAPGAAPRPLHASNVTGCLGSPPPPASVTAATQPQSLQTPGAFQPKTACVIQDSHHSKTTTAGTASPTLTTVRCATRPRGGVPGAREMAPSPRRMGRASVCHDLESHRQPAMMVMRWGYRGVHSVGPIRSSAVSVMRTSTSSRASVL